MGRKAYLYSVLLTCLEMRSESAKKTMEIIEKITIFYRDIQDDILGWNNRELNYSGYLALLSIACWKLWLIHMLKIRSKKGDAI